MSGGIHEYVMGVMSYSDGNLCVGRNATYTSGFKGRYCELDAAGFSTSGIDFPNEKYYNKYLSKPINIEELKKVLNSMQ